MRTNLYYTIHRLDIFFLILALLVAVILGITSMISPIIGLGIALCLLCLVIAVIDPPILGYVVIAGTAFTSGMERGRLIPLLIPNEAILFLSVALSIPYIMLKRVQNKPVPGPIGTSQVILVLGTAIIPLFAFYFRGVQLSISEIIKLLSPIQYLALFWMFFYLPENNAERKNILHWLWICGAVVALIGILQAAGIKPIPAILARWYPSVHEEVATSLRRVTSLMSVWNGLGTFLLINALIIIRLFKDETDYRTRVYLIIGGILCLGCMIASNTYAPMLGLLISLFIFAYLEKGGLQEIGLVFLALAIVAIPFQSSILYRINFQFSGNSSLLPRSLLYRIKVWREVFWPVVKETWLWGYRPSLAALSWQYSENQYLTLILRGGMVALTAHIAWLIITLAWLKNVALKGAEITRSIAIILIASLVVLSLMGLTNEVFTFSGTIEYVWIMLGLAAGSWKSAA